MKAADDGTFTVRINGDWHGWYYLYLIDERVAVTDPYSISLAMNSTKSAVVDLTRTHPEGWETHSRPRNAAHDAVIYELHVKDITGDISSGARNEYRGKFLGLAQEGTQWGDSTTGLDHISELGITHAHILPIQDFISVQEEPEYFFNDSNYNWGYDPEHFNAPEGSYSTDPQNAVLRIRELKEMIMALHKKGVSVVLDVVYNHTFRAFDSNFELIAPGYFHRRLADGSFSNGSGCGNEFSSERPMGRKFIVDSIRYWLEEYKVDGFRFDLMALIDKETVDEILRVAREINPDVLIYGEPWAALPTTLAHSEMTLKGSQQNRDFGLFNDDYRDALRGGNDDASIGYVQGAYKCKTAIETGVTGSIAYDAKRNGFAAEPHESINYFNSHDNLIIADKLTKTSRKEGDADQNIRLLFALTMMSFGTPFFHAGNEFQRSKKMNHNSYNAPLSINGIRWDRKYKHRNLNRYVRDCITFRKMVGVFGEYDAKTIRQRLRFLPEAPEHVIAYEITEPSGDVLLIFHNAGNQVYRHQLANGNAMIQLFDEQGICHTSFYQKIIAIPEKSSAVYRIQRKTHGNEN